jgi:hypothetical protein
MFVLFVLALPDFSRTVAQSPDHPIRLYPDILEETPITASKAQNRGKMRVAAPENSLPNSDSLPFRCW